MFEILKNLLPEVFGKALIKISKAEENGFNTCFVFFAKFNKKGQEYQIWTHDNHPIALWSKDVIAQKIDYIHYNPVRAGWVNYPEQYRYSSAIDYREAKG